MARDVTGSAHAAAVLLHPGAGGVDVSVVGDGSLVETGVTDHFPGYGADARHGPRPPGPRPAAARQRLIHLDGCLSLPGDGDREALRSWVPAA